MLDSNTVRLIQLDCKLREVLREVKQIGLLQRRSFLHKTKPYGGPIQHIDSQAHFGFFPPDQRISLDKGEAFHGSCLASTSTAINFLKPKSENRWEGDMDFRHERPAEMAGLSPSWLLYELYKDTNRLGPLSVDQILNLAKLEVMITTHMVLEMDLLNGRWNINDPDWLLDDWDGEFAR